MSLSMFQSLQTPGNMKDFHAGFQGRVLELNVGDRLSLFLLIYPAHFDSMHHDIESAALEACSASYRRCPYYVLL
jgi:hypothetical protein